MKVLPLARLIGCPARAHSGHARVSGAASAGEHEALLAAIDIAYVPGYKEKKNHPIGSGPSKDGHQVCHVRHGLDCAAAGEENAHRKTAKANTVWMLLIMTTSTLDVVSKWEFLYAPV